MLTLTEFLDDNTHRCYPFADINDLPTDFIVDAHFVTTDNVSKDGLYINQVAIDSEYTKISMAYANDGNIVTLGTVLECPITASRNIEHRIKLVNDEQEVIIEGSITIGTFDTISSMPIGVYNLNTDGLIFSQCIIPVTEWCTGLVINGKLYTGVVHLNFGEGFTIKENADNTIVIGIGELILPDVNTPVVSEKEMQNIAASMLGKGVNSLNGMTGDITIEAGSSKVTPHTYNDLTDANTLSVSTQGNAIVIANNVDDPNYDINADSDAGVPGLDTLLANTRALNERAGAIELHNYAVEGSTNLLSTQMAKVT